MRTCLIALMCVLLSAAGCSVQRERYGEPQRMTDVEPMPVATLVADADRYDGQPVRVSGKVTAVCEKMGCWIRIGEPRHEVFVKFTCPVEGRLIPMDAVGRTAIVEGTAKVEEVSEAEARHYAEDGGATPEEIAKIVGPQKQIRIDSPAAEIERGA